MQTADVVIIGGGIIGLSIAYHLVRREPRLRVVVFEREPLVGTGQTARATGGIRHQFSSEPHVRLTQLSLPLYLRFEAETGYSVNFRPNGYLFVTTDPATLDALRRSVACQQALGVPSRMVDPAEAAALVPGLRTDDLAGGSFCDRDGTAEPAAAVQGFSARARALGAELATGEPVVGLSLEGGRVTGVRTPRRAVAAGCVVVAAGPHSPEVAGLAGVDLPVQAYRRQVAVATPVAALDREIPLTVDADTGFYVHRPGRSELLLGGTDKDTRPGFDLEVDWDGIDRLFAAAIRRLPALEEARLKRTYVGLRDLTPDHHPILGRVEGREGLLVACGFSGHGFMHAPAAGLLTSEEILDGRATTLDLGPFRLGRFARPLVPEANTF